MILKLFQSNVQDETTSLNLHTKLLFLYDIIILQNKKNLNEMSH
jgi:hypothetical protein